MRYEKTTSRTLAGSSPTRLQLLQWCEQQDRQCTYKVVQIRPGLIACKQVTVCPVHIWTILCNVTTRRFRQTILAVEKQQLLHIGLCVYACACVRACVRACMWLPERVGVCMRIRAYSLVNIRHIVTSFVPPTLPLNFSTLYHKRCDCLKKVIEYQICVFIFSTTFV